MKSIGPNDLIGELEAQINTLEEQKTFLKKPRTKILLFGKSIGGLVKMCLDETGGKDIEARKFCFKFATSVAKGNTEKAIKTIVKRIDVDIADTKEQIQAINDEQSATT